MTNLFEKQISMKNIDFEKASFKDFENIEGMDPYGWAKLWGEYVTDRSKNGQFNYRQETFQAVVRKSNSTYPVIRIVTL